MKTKNACWMRVKVVYDTIEMWAASAAAGSIARMVLARERDSGVGLSCWLGWKPTASTTPLTFLVRRE
jgi:hypothetical protein